MFEQLKALSPDPLLGLIKSYQQDSRPQKIDLGVGVYRDEQGFTPVLSCVKKAELQLLQSEDSKSYVGPMGNLAFVERMAELLLAESAVSLRERWAGMQTPGGCGALRVLAETIVRAKPKARLWVSNPTWANHIPLLGTAGIIIEEYSYYNYQQHSIDFDGMLADLQRANAGDLVLLHGCCHNPSGADLTERQWQAVIELCQQKGLVPFIDMAYQGFGRSLDEDAYGVRLATATLPEVIVAVSCSKNFGLYRERVGAAFVLCANAAQQVAVNSHMANITRAMYSMPPSHGATVVADILADSQLRLEWHDELAVMRGRIQGLRSHLRLAMAEALGEDRFAFIESEQGMFSFLGLTPEQVERMAAEFAIYMAGSSRINLAGINQRNLSHLCQSLKAVL